MLGTRFAQAQERKHEVVDRMSCGDRVHCDDARVGRHCAIVLVLTFFICFPFLCESCCVNEMVAPQASFSRQHTPYHTEGSEQAPGARLVVDFRTKLNARDEVLMNEGVKYEP